MKLFKRHWKNMSEISNKKQVIKDLLDYARKNGKITLSELNIRLDEIDITVGDIEKIYEKLEKIGVEIVGVDDGDDVEELEFPDEYEMNMVLNAEGISIDDP